MKLELYLKSVSRPGICKVCGASFPSQASFKRHRKEEHHRVRRRITERTCSRCGLIVFSLKELIAHKEMVHPVVPRLPRAPVKRKLILLPCSFDGCKESFSTVAKRHLHEATHIPFNRYIVDTSRNTITKIEVPALKVIN
jgi:hypothetical protein